MKVAIMQPYFLPYIGYFQLMNLVDEFVVYDNVEYTKKGWINRNRILLNGKVDYLTLPLQKDSDYRSIVERNLAPIWPQERVKVLNRIKQAYSKTPGFEETLPLLQSCMEYGDLNLFYFILNSIELIKNHLGIKTKIIISSQVEANHTLKAELRVIDICSSLGAEEYINPIGGIQLYSESNFSDSGIRLKFLQARNVWYNQGVDNFFPFLSIIDLLMHCGKQRTMRMLDEYDFIENKNQN